MLGLVLGGCIVEEAPSDTGAGEESLPATEPIGCMTHAACPSGMLCWFGGGTCGSEGGTCEPASNAYSDPAICGGPICGCDGIDYADACQAWASGVSAWLEGGCSTEELPEPPPPPVAPDCGEGCGAGEFCFSDDGTCGSSGAGVCRSMSGACTSGSATVCGCDGSTYDSLCDAVQSGVSVAHTGGC